MLAESISTRHNAERGESAERIRMVTICGSIGPICRSVITVGLGLGIWLGLGLLIVVYKLLESDKMRINHVIKTDQWRPARSAFCGVPDQSAVYTFPQGSQAYIIIRQHWFADDVIQSANAHKFII